MPIPDVEMARRAIRWLSPVEAHEVVELGRGSDSVAYAVDGAWVFRFPLAPDAQRTLAREIALLPRLGPRLPLPTPVFEHVGRDGDELVFVGYRLLPGEPLTAERLESLEPAARDAVLDELAGVLDALHAFPVGVARRAGVREERLKGGFHGGQRRLHRDLSPPLRADEVERLEAIVAAYARDTARELPAPAVLHADLKPQHVRYDAAAGRIAGVLDWGDACLGDPDFDLAVIGIFFGPRFLARLLERLPGRDAALVARKARFFSTLRWLQDLAYALERGDAAVSAASLARLRAHLAALDR